MTPEIQPAAADEARFAIVFGNLNAIVRYAAHRGSRDPEGIAAEVMTLAWRKLDVTARNLVMAERRRARRQPALDPRQGERVAAAVAEGGDPAITAALLDLH